MDMFGKSKRSHPILVKFIPFCNKFKIPRSNRILTGTEDALHSEYPAKTRAVSVESMPCMKDARSRGLMHFKRRYASCRWKETRLGLHFIIFENVLCLYRKINVLSREWSDCRRVLNL
jgi:hypothetical protein